MPVLFLDCLNGMVELWQRVLRPEDPPIQVNIADGQPDGLPTLLDGFDICINDHTFFDADLLARCADLRHIVFLGTGASSFIDLAAAASRGIKVHTIRGYGDTSVAEHTIALAMAAARNVARMDRDVRAGRWRQIEGLQLYGKTLGSSASAVSAARSRASHSVSACRCSAGIARRSPRRACSSLRWSRC